MCLFESIQKTVSQEQITMYLFKNNKEVFMKSTKSVNSSVSSAIAGEWETPDELFQELDRVYHFTLDACARPKMPSARSSSLRRKMVLHRIGAAMSCIAALRAGPEICACGLRRVLLRARRRTRPLSCCCRYRLMLPGFRNTSISSLAFGCISCRNELSSPTACCRPMQSMVRTERRTLSVVCGPQWLLCLPARSASSAVNE